MSARSGVGEIYAVGLWLWASGVLILAAGLLGRLDRSSLIAFAAVIVGGAALLALRARRTRAVVLQAARSHPILSGAILAVILSDLAMGMAPPTARDVLIHHLAIPRLYLEAGRIYEIPFAPPASYPQTLEMLYLVPLGLGCDWAAAWVHLGFGILAAGVLGARARRWAGDRAGMAAALLFLSLPVVVRLGSTAYVDLGLCLFGFLAMEYFLRWVESEEKSRDLVLSGFAVGLGLSVKYSALVLATCLVLLVALRVGRHKSLARVVRATVLFSVLSLVPAVPWLARNAWFHGNPFFPLFHNLFHDERTDEPRIPSPLLLRHLMYGEGLFELTTLPVRIFLQGAEGDPRRFDGRLNPFLLPLVALLLSGGSYGRPRNGLGTTAWFVLVGTVLTLTTAVARVRYVLPFVAYLCPMVATMLAWDRISGKRRLAAMVLFAGAFAWSGFYIFRALSHEGFLPYLFHRESRESYLSRKLPLYDVYRCVNSLVQSDERVQLLFTGDQGYYLKVPYTYDSYFSGRQLARVLLEGPDAVEATFTMTGVTHLLVQKNLIFRFVYGRFGPEGVHAWDAFIATRTTPLYSRDPFALYRVNRSTGKPISRLGARSSLREACR